MSCSFGLASEAHNASSACNVLDPLQNGYATLWAKLGFSEPKTRSPRSVIPTAREGHADLVAGGDGSRQQFSQSIERSRATNNGAIHASGIESTRTLASTVDDLQHLGGSAWNAERVAVHVIGDFVGGRNIVRIYSWAGDLVLNACGTDGAGVLCFRAKDGGSGSKICTAADKGSSAEVGADAYVLKLPRED